MTIIFFIITILYLILIGWFVFGFNKIQEFIKETATQTTTFSIVIPFRNESENLPKLLKSLNQLEYPKDLFEVILVDDDSEDDSFAQIMRFFASHRFDFKVISNKRTTNSPKKDAITTAVNVAKYEWIITTDADCIFPKKWLKTFDTFIKSNNPKMIVAPVTYTTNNSFLEQFQLLDFLSLQGATIAGFGINKPFLCNGANLAYKKEVFVQLNGFEGNTSIASGDDIFLLEKAITTFSKQVHYLKSEAGIVTTKPQSSVAELIQQRVRWASKTTAYNNRFGKLVGIMVLLMNAIIIIAFVLSAIGVFNWFYFAFLFSSKFIIDFVLIYKTAYFFKQTKSLTLYPLCTLVYPLFSVFVAVYSQFFSYKWKQRRF
jgi:cellulose synthase/poly-beta-1,6-N-acetylglucosamine synthase-like glycosyltransferase